MAFASNRSGRFDVYVRPFPSGSGEWLVSTNGGEQPRWRADGHELFFLGLDGKMMAAAVKATSGPSVAFEADVPIALFESHVALGRNALHYDVTPDGKRFLVRATTTAPSQPLTVVTNWTTASGK